MRLSLPCSTLGAALLLAAALAPAAAQAPTGAPTPPAAAPATPPAAATARPVRQSWTSARRSFVVGDVVTVLVDEYTLASANTNNSASDRRRRDLGFGARLPGGTGSTSMSADIGTDNNTDSRQSGEALRQNRFQSEMSVRIVAVDSATGLLQLQGAKLVDVDKNKQEVTFTGWVRPQDVSPQNTVESFRVADAQLLYTAKGNLGKPKGGILGRILGMVWP